MVFPGRFSRFDSSLYPLILALDDPIDCGYLDPEAKVPVFDGKLGSVPLLSLGGPPGVGALPALGCPVYYFPKEPDFAGGAECYVLVRPGG